MTSGALSLDTLTGARQQVSLILPVRLSGVPSSSWKEGPFPFRLGTELTDAAARSTYFTPAAARALYGAPGQPCRWHRRTTHGPQDPYGIELEAVELLRTATSLNPEHALAVLHITVHGPHLLTALRALAGRRTAGPDPLAGPLDPRTLLNGAAELSGTPRPYTVAFLTPAAEHIPAQRPGPGAPVPDSADRWLWQLAARTDEHDYPLAPESASDHARETVRISADWSAQVLRHGAAFLGHRPDTGEGDFYDFGALHARTIYLDALLLGTIQRHHIDEIANDLSGIFDSARLTRQVSALERRIAHFRSTYWRQHLTAHGPANELLLAFQAQHRLPERFTEILEEAADYARLVQTRESQQMSGALGLLTVLGLPLGTALGILQVLGDDSVAHLLIALAVALLAAGASLCTRYGRLVLEALRGV